jgi:hypothetical protein
MSFNSRKLLFGSPYFTDPYWNNTSLLLHGDGIGSTPNGQQNNTFLDSSTNNFTITRRGTPTQGAFSPFALNGVAYSPTIHGGGAYFPGVNSNYLSVPSNAAFNFTSGTFTVESWCMTTNASAIQTTLTNYNSASTGWVIQIYLNKFIAIFSGDTVDIQGTTTVLPNVWYHVAISGSAGSYKLFVNGVQEGSTYTGATSLAGGILGVGAIGDRIGSVGLYPMVGYISNARIVNGRACYTSNFTPPTSPVTLTSNGGATPSTAPTSGQVALLCDFTNAGIFDNTKKNVLTTVGDSKVSTSVVKYGTGSMAFDGSVDYLSNYTSQGAASTTFGTASFTVEMWVYFNTVAGNQGFCDASNQIGVSTTTGQFFFYKTATGLAFGNHNIGNLLTYNWTPIASVWYHVAVSRLGTSLKMFINGVEVASVINSTNFIGSGINIGVVATPYYLNGYIDDLRITKGIARYTSSFTPPTRAFPNK